MIEKILEQRGNRYGSFLENANLCQRFKTETRILSGYYDMSTTQREAIEMIFHKIARIVVGDSNYKDSWVDIIGYAQLAIDEIEANSVEDDDKIPF